MASKKTKKILKLKDYNTLVLNDVLCPICRSILIEPVSLPCNHDFCQFCFEGTMENANLVCPLCRLRIGSWLRKVKKENNLINLELWKCIKDRFPQHVKNKLNGVDENIEEDREIIVSYPGEIRKEYEMQKQKDEEEQRKKQDAESKASEELIKKLKEEEDYQKAVMENKLKLDEELAKKLSVEVEPKQASTSKIKVVYKNHGPLDKFVKKEDDTATLNPDSFVNKEYTCRVLCLGSKPTKETNVKDFSPKIQKKIQQIQKIVDLDRASDGSDIESEMRYFKPIEHRLNPPSQRKSPLKITPRKLQTNTAAKILSPSGTVNFTSNILQSAFARFSIEVPKSSNTSLSSSSKTNITPLSSKRPLIKRTLSPNTTDFETPDKKPKMNKSLNIIDLTDDKVDSPVLDCKMGPVVRKKLFAGVQNCEKNVESPPFYGFKNTDNKQKKLKQKNSLAHTNCARSNGKIVEQESLAEKLKREQEKADLEFAKRLQEEFDRGRYMRSSRRMGISKRQSTLDEIIKSPYKVK